MVFENNDKTRLRFAKRAIGGIQKFTARIETEDSTDIDVCIRPLRELHALESQHYELFGYGSEARKDHPIRTSVTFARSAGSLALFYGSAHFLEYRSHRFTFNNDDSTYHREAFDVDSQAVGSRPVNLSSIEELVANDQAYDELMWLKNAIEITRQTEWVHAKSGFVTC